MTEPLDPSLASIAHLASPLAVCATITPNFRARDHQKIISDAIVAAFFGNGPKKIAISQPPQTGKSTLVSIATPLWVMEMHTLGLLPGGLCGLVSYEDSLPMSWSKKVRRELSAHPELFSTRLRPDSRAASYWENEAEGGIIATGIGGTIVGRSITYLDMDDLIKNFAQASSQLHRDTAWNFWHQVGIGRLQQWSVVVATMTRWHADDIIGRITSDEYEGDPSEWLFLNFPAIAEEGDHLGRAPGEALLRPQWDQTPEVAKEEMLSVKNSISEYSWNALWQGRPSDPAGTIFYESKWRYYGGDSTYILPNHFSYIAMSWDMAFKDEDDSDYVVGQAWGVSGSDYFLLDEIRGRWDFTVTKQMVRNFAYTIRTRYPNATTVLVEDKANGTAIINALRSTVGGFIPVSPKESKIARAHSVQPLLLGGNLYIPSDASANWVREYVKEMSAFPRGTHDDRVDCTTQALNYLVQFGHGGARWHSPAATPLRAPQDADSNNRPSRIRGAGRVTPDGSRVAPLSAAATARREGRSHPLRGRSSHLPKLRIVLPGD